MSQFDFGNLESPLPGSVLINDNLEPWRDALHSLHSGPSRPPYAIPGMAWVNNTTNPWVLNMFTGSADIPIGYFDTDTDTFTPAGVSQDADQVNYDNSDSGLAATNVQAAIDESYTDFNDFADRPEGFSTAAQGEKADTALQSAALDVVPKKIYSGTISSSVAAIDSVNIFRAGYNYRIEIENLLPSTLAANLWALFSSDGVTWINSGYKYIGQMMTANAGSLSYLNSTSASNMIVAFGGFDNGAGNTFESTLIIRNPMNPTAKTKLRSEFDGCADGSANARTGYISNQDSTNRAISSLRILASTGNITQAKISIYEEAQ